MAVRFIILLHSTNKYNYEYLIKAKNPNCGWDLNITLYYSTLDHSF